MSVNDWTSNDVTANGIRLHYRRTGGQKPVMVLAHGITDNGMCWARLAEALENSYDLILYDARGHGLSDAPEKGYTIADHTADLIGLIETLELVKPILMGHSMGGTTAAQTAAQRSDLVRALILEDPVLMALPPIENLLEHRDLFIEQFRRDLLERKQMTLEQLIEQCRREVHPNWTVREYTPWARAKLQVSPHVAETLKALPFLKDVFPNVSCPVLILRAEVDPDTAEEDQKITRKLARGKLIHLKGAGHNIRRDQFAETLHYIQEFLKDISP